MVARGLLASTELCGFSWMVRFDKTFPFDFTIIAGTLHLND